MIHFFIAKPKMGPRPCTGRAGHAPLLCTMGPSTTSLVSTHNKPLVCPFSPTRKGYDTSTVPCVGRVKNCLGIHNYCLKTCADLNRSFPPALNHQTGWSHHPSLPSPPRDPCVPCVYWWLSTSVQGVCVRAHSNSFIFSSHPGHYGHSSK